MIDYKYFLLSQYFNQRTNLRIIIHYPQKIKLNVKSHFYSLFMTLENIYEEMSRKENTGAKDIYEEAKELV
jgi:hypothetical protein